MASHFEAIGFPVATQEDAERLAEQVRPQTAGTPVEAGTYLRWAPGSGEELWLRLDRHGRVTGLAPHFSGASRQRLRLEERFGRRGDAGLDGAFLACSLDPVDDSEWSQLVFDAPDAAAHADVPLPAVASVQVAAFAHSVDVHESPDAFAAAQAGEEMRFASQSFMALGLWSDELGGDAPASQAEAVFSGHVVESSRRENPLTGNGYVWAAVETLGGVYDVVAAPEQLPAPPPPGAVVFGSFWLSGRLLEEPRPEPRAESHAEPSRERRGFLRRLLG